VRGSVPGSIQAFPTILRFINYSMGEDCVDIYTVLVNAMFTSIRNHPLKSLVQN